MKEIELDAVVYIRWTHLCKQRRRRRKKRKEKIRGLEEGSVDRVTCH